MKILWTLDAFEEPYELQDKCTEFLRELSKRIPLEVTPVHVLSPDNLGLAVDFSEPWKDRYVPAAAKALALRIREAVVPGLQEPEVIVCNRPSLKGAVQTLSAWAATEGYEMILTASHGRKGLSRAIMGSFAEELLMQSRLPVMVMGKGVDKVPTDDPHILFPTDLSDSSSASFDEVVKLAARLKARITLLHVIPRPIEPVIQSGVYLVAGGWIPVRNYVESELVRQREIAARWKERASRSDVRVDTVIDSDAPGITDSILSHAAAKEVTLIAMAAESSRVTVTLLGSITRQVVRDARVPTWVVRVKQKGG